MSSGEEQRVTVLSSHIPATIATIIDGNPTTCSVSIHSISASEAVIQVDDCSQIGDRIGLFISEPAPDAIEAMKEAGVVSGAFSLLKTQAMVVKRIVGQEAQQTITVRFTGNLRVDETGP